MSNPFEFLKPVSPSNMIGRWHLVEEITRGLTNPGGHSYMIVAGRRFGKSSFLKALEDILLKQIEQKKPSDQYFVPVLVDLHGLENRSTRGVFDFFLKTLYECFKPDTDREIPGINLSIDLESTKLHSYMFKRSKQKTCSFERFSDILKDLRKIFLNHYGCSLCLIYLLDEIETVLNEQWTEALFDHLRSLIYSGPLIEYIRYVIVGASGVVKAKQKGSPLLNMLDIQYLEVLSDQGIQTIIKFANEVPTDVIRAVMEYCGGHPFIAQYLMYHLWEKDLTKTTRATVEKELVYKFMSERVGDLETWRHEIDEAGQKTYAVLAQANCWLEIKEVRQLVNTPRLDIQLWLDRLCYHGLAQRDDTWRYHATGRLFKEWFEENVLPASSIATTSTSATNPIEIFYVYALEDKDMLSQLEMHIATMKRRGLITDWHNERILPGQNIMSENEQHWNSARIILLLVSPGFMKSDMAYKDSEKAMQKQKEGTKVIPIILKPVNWKGAAFEELQVLPAGGKPIVDWRPRDAAFTNVVEGIQKVVDDLIRQ